MMPCCSYGWAHGYRSAVCMKLVAIEAVVRCGARDGQRFAAQKYWYIEVRGGAMTRRTWIWHCQQGSSRKPS